MEVLHRQQAPANKLRLGYHWKAPAKPGLGPGHLNRRWLCASGLEAFHPCISVEGWKEGPHKRPSKERRDNQGARRQKPSPLAKQQNCGRDVDDPQGQIPTHLSHERHPHIYRRLQCETLGLPQRHRLHKPVLDRIRQNTQPNKRGLLDVQKEH